MAKKILRLGLVLSFDERKRLADYFAILLPEYRNLKVTRRRCKTTAKKKEKKSEKKRKSNYDIKLKEIGPSTGLRTGSLFCGPLFFCTLLYHWVKNNQLVISQMIDTIVLLLSNEQFIITKPELFKPHAGWVLNANKRGTPSIYAKQNPTKRELKEGTYKPQTYTF